MDLMLRTHYDPYGLDKLGMERLARLGDLLLSAGVNVTSIRNPEEIERIHFLDSLSLLKLAHVAGARRLADVGSGGGMPALVLAIALAETRVVAIESVGRKCAHIESCARALGLTNLVVQCARAEEYGRTNGRAVHDVVVSRAVATLPVIAEYSLPLLGLGGLMVAMKGAISTQERIQAASALAILGGDRLEVQDLMPFEGAQNRWAYMARKIRETPAEFPRRSGVPAKRPLGGSAGR